MSGPGARYTREEKLAAVRIVAEELGSAPKISEYREHRDDDMPTQQAISYEFADADSPWLRALEAAGLDPDPAEHDGGSPDQDDVAFALAAAAAELEEWPSPDQYRDLGLLPSVPTIYSRYDSWPEAVDAAQEEFAIVAQLVEHGPLEPADTVGTLTGLERHLVERQGSRQRRAYGLPGHRDSRTDDSDAGRSDVDEIADAVSRAARDCGEPLGAEEYRSWATGRDDAPCLATVYNHDEIENWTAACELAGVEQLGEG